MFELWKLVKKNTIVGHHNGRKTQKNPCLLAFFLVEMTILFISTGYTIEGDRMDASCYTLICITALQLNCLGWFVSWPNGAFEVDNAKFSSSNDLMFGLDLTQKNNQGV